MALRVLQRVGSRPRSGLTIRSRASLERCIQVTPDAVDDVVNDAGEAHSALYFLGVTGELAFIKRGPKVQRSGMRQSEGGGQGHKGWVAELIVERPLLLQCFQGFAIEPYGLMVADYVAYGLAAGIPVLHVLVEEAKTGLGAKERHRGRR